MDILEATSRRKLLISHMKQRRENMSTDKVSWVVEKNGSSGNLENQIFKPGMTWMTTSDVGALDIQFRGYFENSTKGLWTYSDWETVYIRFLAS